MMGVNAPVASNSSKFLQRFLGPALCIVVISRPLFFPLFFFRSLLVHILEEAQQQWMIQCIQRMQVEGIASMEPKADVEKKWNDECRRS